MAIKYSKKGIFLVSYIALSFLFAQLALAANSDINISSDIDRLSDINISSDIDRLSDIDISSDIDRSLDSDISSDIDISYLVQAVSQDVQGMEIPSPFNSLFGDERVNIHLDLAEGDDIIIALVTEGGKVKNLVTAEVKDPSLNVYTTQTMMMKILIADNPLPVLQEAVKEKKIRYEAVGFKNKIKYFFVSLITRITLASDRTRASDRSSEHTVTEQASLIEDIGDDKSNDDAEGSNVSGDVDDSAKEGAIDADQQGGTEATGERHEVNLIDGGFGVDGLIIKAGDTIVWKNVRTGTFKKALIIGNQKCREVKSRILMPGEEYEWTFEEPLSCLISDGIYTTESMKVAVE